MADPVRQQLGNYRFIRPIGHGGFADVYLGEHIYLKTQVAVKILQMRLTNEDMEGFLKEARTIAHFVHPHIFPHHLCTIKFLHYHLQLSKL